MMVLLYNSIMNYKTLNFSSWGEYLSSLYTFNTLFIILIIMPILYIYLLGKKKEILDEQYWKDMFGVIYDDNKFDTKI
jgi:hypothetical protein